MPKNPQAESLYRLIGQRVRGQREESGVTQERLATRAQIARTTITNLEQGNQAITIHQIFAIADALDVEIGKLLPTRAELAALRPGSLRISGIGEIHPGQTQQFIDVLLSSAQIEEDRG